MDVRWVTAEGIEDHQVKHLKALLEREDGEVFGFHPLAVKACAERNHIPRVHAYADHVFVVLNAGAVVRDRVVAGAWHGRGGAGPGRHHRRAGAAHPGRGAQGPGAESRWCCRSCSGWCWRCWCGPSATTGGDAAR